MNLSCKIICAERKNPKILAGMSFLGEGIKGNFYSFCLYFSVFAKFSTVAITIIYDIIIFIISKKKNPQNTLEGLVLG